MHPEFVMMKWATGGTISGNELQNTQSQRSRICPKWKLFSHHSSLQSTQSDAMSIIYHNKHDWESLIFLMTLANEKWSRWYNTSELKCSIKKAYLNCILFHCFVQFLYWMSSSWIHHQSVHQTISLQPYLTTDKSLELCIREFIL